MWIGVPLFAANSLEPWFDFRDSTAVKIQLGTSLVALCMTCFSYSPWGKRYKLAIFTSGYLLGVATFEAVVCRERAFGTAYSDGFPTLFAFYSVLIPLTTLRTTAVGIATIALLSIPEALMTGDVGRVPSAFGTGSTAFVILLSGRHIANKLWELEFLSSRRHIEFVSAVSHEFRNLVASICMLTEKLKPGTILNESEKSDCHRILASAGERLRRRVEELLEFGRMLAGAVEYALEEIDPARLLRDVTAEFQSEVTHRGYEVQVKVVDDLPFVYGSRTALASVIWNLLDNAVKYSPECFTVWAEARLVNDRIEFRVCDHGHGVPKDEQQHIFQKFIRGGAAKAGVIEGLGLGLYIVTRIVEAHHGVVSLESELGKGSIFAVHLPVGRRDDQYHGSRGRTWNRVQFKT
jgi:signal transduction histidine kinase